MSSFAATLAKRVLRRSGYVPNISNLLVQPGAIVSVHKGRFQLEGRLDRRARENQDTAAADLIAPLIDGFDVGRGTGDEDQHKFGLKYKSEGTTMFSFEGEGKELPIGGVKVTVNALIKFAGKSDYVFDTTEPISWFAFDASQIDDIFRIALQHLEKGELIVTGVAWAQKHVWYVSKSRDAQLGFGVTGDPSGGVDIGKLAELSAKLSLRASHGEVLDGRGANSVALFQASVKRKPRRRTPDIGPYALSATVLGRAGELMGNPDEEVGPLYPEDLAELGDTSDADF